MDNSTSIETVAVKKVPGIRDMPVGIIEIIKKNLTDCDSYLMFVALEDANWVGESGYWWYTNDIDANFKSLKYASITVFMYMMETKVIIVDFSMFTYYMPKFLKYSNVDICDYVFDRFKHGSKENEKHGIEDGFRACDIFEYWVSVVCVEKNVSMLMWLMKTFPLKTYFAEYIISGIARYSKFEEGNDIMSKYVYRGVPCQGIWNKPYFNEWKSYYAKK